jgi:hypothetical protein
MMLTLDEYMALRRLITSERESEGASDALRNMPSSASAPKRRASAYNRRYKAAFKKVAPRYKLKNGNWKSNGFRSAVRAAHKMAKK